MNKIPTNIITGFLGVGKTTAILNLLANKPESEVWAVLVNEFGEIGVDGALLKGQGAVVKEVPGGCMCCVAGLPMQVGLNTLIAKSKPDRLLIEPTGLGHPKQIIDTLTNEYYGDLLDLNATITLVDPRNLNNVRYLENENFRDQLALADVVIANKIDECDEQDKQRFEHKMKTYSPKKHVLGWVCQGAINPDWLSLPRVDKNTLSIAPEHHHKSTNDLPAATLVLDDGADFICKENIGHGFQSCGWLFSSASIFDHTALHSFFSGLDVDRLKAVIKTDKGVFSFNAVKGVLSVSELSDAIDSRIEIIHNQAVPWNKVEDELLECITKE